MYDRIFFRSAQNVTDVSFFVVTPEGSHAGVHRAASLGHGANRFTESDREGAVVGVSIPDGASTRD